MVHTQAQDGPEGDAGSELTDATKSNEGSYVCVADHGPQSRPFRAASAKLDTGLGAAAASNSTVHLAVTDNVIEQNGAERLQALAANEEEPCDMTARKDPRMVNTI